MDDLGATQYEKNLAEEEKQIVTTQEDLEIQKQMDDLVAPKVDFYEGRQKTRTEASLWINFEEVKARTLQTAKIPQDQIAKNKKIYKRKWNLKTQEITSPVYETDADLVRDKRRNSTTLAAKMNAVTAEKKSPQTGLTVEQIKKAKLKPEEVSDLAAFYPMLKKKLGKEEATRAMKNYCSKAVDEKRFRTMEQFTALILELNPSKYDLSSDEVICKNATRLESMCRMTEAYKSLLKSNGPFVKGLKESKSPDDLTFFYQITKQLDTLTAMSNYYRVRKLIISNPLYINRAKPLSLDTKRGDAPEKKRLRELLRVSYYLAINYNKLTGHHMNENSFLILGSREKKSDGKMADITDVSGNRTLSDRFLLLGKQYDGNDQKTIENRLKKQKKIEESISSWERGGEILEKGAKSAKEKSSTVKKAATKSPETSTPKTKKAEQMKAATPTIKTTTTTAAKTKTGKTVGASEESYNKISLDSDTLFSSLLTLGTKEESKPKTTQTAKPKTTQTSTSKASKTVKTNVTKPVSTKQTDKLSKLQQEEMDRQMALLLDKDLNSLGGNYDPIITFENNIINTNNDLYSLEQDPIQQAIQNSLETYQNETGITLDPVLQKTYKQQKQNPKAEAAQGLSYCGEGITGDEQLVKEYKNLVNKTKATDYAEPTQYTTDLEYLPRQVGNKTLTLFEMIQRDKDDEPLLMDLYLTSNLKVIESNREMIAAYDQSYPGFQLYMDRRVDLLKKMESMRKKHPKKAPGNVLDARGKVLTDQTIKNMGDAIYDPKNHFSLTGVQFFGHQTTSVGCWSSSMEIQLKYRGIDLNQQQIRAYRPTNIQHDDIGKFKDDTHADMEFIGSNKMGSPVEVSEIMNICQDNVATHMVEIDNTQQSFKVGNPAVLAAANIEYLRRSIVDGIAKHKSPVSFLMNGHYVTIFAIEGTKIKYYDSLSSRKDGICFGDLAHIYNNCAAYNSARMQLVWYEQLDTVQNGAIDDIRQRTDAIYQGKNLTLVDNTGLDAEIRDRGMERSFNSKACSFVNKKSINEKTGAMNNLLPPGKEYVVNDSIYLPRKMK